MNYSYDNEYMNYEFILADEVLFFDRSVCADAVETLMALTGR